ncbi:phosphate ABC transporter permease PstA [Teredinibacter sp. KSP-S5-2]|uniref:phosphate ABC transporter permease PstA n=1 Tax=Teredinibacter sp. KSP-S5-2 TaxID=3034506 RepID=UPI00293421C9|nr:phosphate ABC transporter permease PstA [Teredinibacter sp. KSP-S5-2]WNO09078.1 phosphate ABC transporter permease PstA [Teredinibacter sp. KSP-S5-2]
MNSHQKNIKPQSVDNISEQIQKNLKRRYRSEKIFKSIGLLSVLFSMLALGVLFSEIFGRGFSSFRQTYIELDIQFDREAMYLYDMEDLDQLNSADYGIVVKQALLSNFPAVQQDEDQRELARLLSIGVAYQVKSELEKNPQLLGGNETLWVLADDDVDTYIKSFGATGSKGFSTRLSEQQKQWIAQLQDNNQIKQRFNTSFFSNGDSSEPEIAGIYGAIVGSMLTLLVTFCLSFPIGVAAAVYLEEYAPQNKWTEFIEVNINNLAAVPSIIFGLLGLAIFIGILGVPRSVPLVGGLVLTLMTLPTIIISSRASIKAVPPSIKEAAYGVGASKMQVILNHVLPAAMPGMLTGAIIGMAQALGETAPLLMIGMVAFIVDIPSGITDPATVLPVQIYLWADSPEKAFVELTSAAIMVLLAFLVFMNALAVWLRKRLEKRW